MARPRKKKRTHIGANNVASQSQSRNVAKDPKSMVIRMGASKVGSSVTQLALDVRAMMEPGTASRLKERRANRLRDYVTMAGPLGVSHLLLFSRSDAGNTNLRIALAPRGPTLYFNVENYALCKDIKKSMKRPPGGGKESDSPPLLVLNGFLTSEAEAAGANARVPKHLEKLVTSVFQSLFPPISPQNMHPKSVSRVLLLNREKRKKATSDSEPEKYIISLRHYAIQISDTGRSRPVRRLFNTKRSAPDLGKQTDVSDFFLNPDAGYTSASESEMETKPEVEVPHSKIHKVRKSKMKKEQSRSETMKKAISLKELGPRMRLKLIKVTEGLADEGETLWHDHVTKSKEEKATLGQAAEKKKAEKEKRKKEQKENVARKKGKEEEKEKEKGGIKGKEATDDQEDDEMDIDEWDSEMELDEEGEELGQEGETNEADGEIQGPLKVPIR
ncbi:MAG: hypothetical protein M1814_006718 [Vezdaea aestivalis]|nr:MAG: hypothetical protein M1814_006718 [Vezdaea aestivalis]